MCQTSYSVDEFKVLDGRRQWISLGFNVTKVIDMNRCSASDYEVYNKVIPGANENTDAVSGILVVSIFDSFYQNFLFRCKA